MANKKEIRDGASATTRRAPSRAQVTRELADAELRCAILVTWDLVIKAVHLPKVTKKISPEIITRMAIFADAWLEAYATGKQIPHELKTDMERLRIQLISGVLTHLTRRYTEIATPLVQTLEAVTMTGLTTHKRMLLAGSASIGALRVLRQWEAHESGLSYWVTERELAWNVRNMIAAKRLAEGAP